MHFTLTVFGASNQAELEEMMAPYQEDFDEASDSFNENGYWDWWLIGGRWSGYFKLKPGRSGVLGQPGVFDNEAPPGTADQCQLGDIDIEGMRLDRATEAAALYDRCERFSVDVGDFEDREALSAYFPPEEYGYFLNVKTILDTASKEEYVGFCASEALPGYATLVRGEGWFESDTGFAPTPNPARQDYLRRVNMLFDNMTPTTVVTMVDYHC